VCLLFYAQVRHQQWRSAAQKGSPDIYSKFMGTIWRDRGPMFCDTVLAPTHIQIGRIVALDRFTTRGD